MPRNGISTGAWELGGVGSTDLSNILSGKKLGLLHGKRYFNCKKEKKICGGVLTTGRFCSDLLSRDHASRRHLGQALRVTPASSSCAREGGFALTVTLAVQAPETVCPWGALSGEALWCFHTRNGGNLPLPLPPPGVWERAARFGLDAGGSSVELGAPALSHHRPTRTQRAWEPEGTSEITSFHSYPRGPGSPGPRRPSGMPPCQTPTLLLLPPSFRNTVSILGISEIKK